jgi:Membrane bound O-acyl transferase family
MGFEHNISRYWLELEGEEHSGTCSTLDKKMVRANDQAVAMTYHLRDFVRTEIAKAFAWYLLFDLCWYPLSISKYNAVPAPDVFSDSLSHQVILALAMGIMNYCSLSLQFSLFAALTVGIGMYTPQDWPPLMGRLRDVSTVRDFWGKFWHQNLRRVCSVTSIFSKKLFIYAN